MTMAKASSKPKARKRKRINCPQITEYMRLVETGKVRSCERQRKLCAYVRRTFAEEELIIDTERIERFGGYLKYFPFDRLFPWEWFLLTLFLCVFTKDGEPRWNTLICFIGRGAGKTAFIAFIAFCCMTKWNRVLGSDRGIDDYDVDIIANTEKQARRSFKVIHKMMTKHRAKFKPFFAWNLEVISSLNTGAELHALTSNPASLDGLASGLFICDEVHYMDSYENITTLKTGQGKTPHKRRAYISSNGNKREGVFDQELKRCDQILDGLIDDDGYLPFVCMLESEEQVHDPRNWEIANPSLPYDKDLFIACQDDYKDWMRNPYGNPDFMTKRMGLPQGDKENEVASWEDLTRAMRDLPDLTDYPCVCGIDLAKKDDFISAALLFKVDGEYFVKHHSWLCRHSRDWSRIDSRVTSYDNPDSLTIVDDVDIPITVVTDWIYEQQEHYDIVKVAFDDFRQQLLRPGLEDLGYSFEGKTARTVRPSDHMKVLPVIDSALKRGEISWGNELLMRWFAHNTKIVQMKDFNGNYKYEKIEPKGRKTDGFMAMVAAFCIADVLPRCTFERDDDLDDFSW